jgi:hypothetical protein
MMELFGLLHLEQRETTAVNVSVATFAEQIDVYLKNAILLARTLRTRGIGFTLLTNAPAQLSQRLIAIGSDLTVLEIPFVTAVPPGTRFYSAHFKFDAFRHLAGLDAPYVGLCDLDMVCNGDVPQSLRNVVANGSAICYDISDQVIPAYGASTIIRDLEQLHGLRSEGRWLGGEFLAGPPSFFKALCAEVDRLFEGYVRAVPTLHHVGDEALTSAAVEVLRQSNVYVADAGTLGIVRRYWSSKPLHAQAPFSACESTFLLHLPSDKKFLAHASDAHGAPRSGFTARYRRHLRWSPTLLMSRLRGVLRGLRTRWQVPSSV